VQSEKPLSQKRTAGKDNGRVREKTQRGRKTTSNKLDKGAAEKTKVKAYRRRGGRNGRPTVKKPLLRTGGEMKGTKNSKEIEALKEGGL